MSESAEKRENVQSSDSSDLLQQRCTKVELFVGVLVLWIVLGSFGWLYGLYKQPVSQVGFYLTASVCGIAATLAYVLVWFTRGTCYSMEGMLGSVLFRTLIPLVAAPCVAVLLPDSNKGDIFENFVVFYLLTLFMETLLSVHLTKKFDERVASSTENQTSQRG